jgi:hypothetical protein
LPSSGFSKICQQSDLGVFFQNVAIWEEEAAQLETVFASKLVLKGRVNVTANAGDLALDVCRHDNDSRYASCAPT